MIISPPALRATNGRLLVTEALFNRLASRIAADHPELAADLPRRILDQALAFLGTCATATEPLGPSDLVDIGWHTFLIYTSEYAAFCDRVAGRFIHHQPDDGPGEGWPTYPKSAAATVAAMRAAGFHVDPDLWNLTAADCNSKCTQCHAGCHNSPTG